MCGIWFFCGTNSCGMPDIGNFFKIAHRGPDAWRCEADARMPAITLGFHRLSIVDGIYGIQPMHLLKYPYITLLCNGEIYNCQRLRTQFDFCYETKCDVECIIHLYATQGIENTVKNLDGVFSFILIDWIEKEVHIARDPYGVRPSFILRTPDGELGVSSEAKGLINCISLCKGNAKVTPFPPGCYASYKVLPSGLTELKFEKRYYDIGTTKPFFQVLVPWEDLSGSDIKRNIRTLLTAAVEKRLMSDRRIGCLLSGGLDSSLVAGLLVEAAKKKGLPYKIQSFSIGMESSPDLVAARQVAEYIGTEHHEVVFSKDDIRHILGDIIFTLETPDITTIRASIGMYLLSKYIKDKTDSTVIFSGEGADELAQGYIYFKNAPSAKDAHDESIRLLKDIYLFDGLRADRTTAAHSLELRLPFLDLQFSSYYLSLPPESRQPVDGIEKYLLRDAFRGTGLIPDNILWRHKEAFSDGVASVKKSLFEVIQEVVDERLSDSQADELRRSYSACTPKTKESTYYRSEFEQHYKGHCEEFMGYFWMPKWTEVSDPSARFISHYKAE